MDRGEELEDTGGREENAACTHARTCVYVSALNFVISIESKRKLLLVRSELTTGQRTSVNISLRLSVLFNGKPCTNTCVHMNIPTLPPSMREGKQTPTQAHTCMNKCRRARESERAAV